MTGPWALLSRTCGIEWLQSTWLKSCLAACSDSRLAEFQHSLQPPKVHETVQGMIEQNVPPQLAAVGERMAKVVGRWWQKAIHR